MPDTVVLILPDFTIVSTDVEADVSLETIQGEVLSPKYDAEVFAYTVEAEVEIP